MSIEFPLARTEIGPAERDAVNDVLTSGRLAAGPEMAAFEQSFAEYCKVPYGVMVNSGTSALTIVLLSLGVGPGDEVIMPSLTFAATLNGVLATGARAVLVDVDEQGLIDASAVKCALSPATAAIVPVDLYGRCVDVPALRREIDVDVPIVEDAAEALGAFRSSSLGFDFHAGHVSGYASAAIFGFYPNKVLTTGEGGMLVTADRELADSARLRINQSRTGEHMSGPLPGFSLRGNEMAAAMGRTQLASLTVRLEQRRQLAAHYLRHLDDIPTVRPFVDDVHGTSWFTMPILTTGGTDPGRLQETLQDEGVESARYFPALHREPAVTSLGGEGIRLTECPVTERIADHILCLPFWPGLDQQLPVLMARLEQALSRV